MKSAFGVVHKSSYYRNGKLTYQAITEMREGQKNALRSQMKTAKDQKQSRRSLFSRDPDNEFFHGATQQDLSSLPLVSRKDRSVRDFMDGFKSVSRVVPSKVHQGAGEMPPNMGAMVTVHRGRPRVLMNGHMGNRREFGAHEAAHYATRSSARRGKTRNIMSLGRRINTNPLALAREEARADGTAIQRGHQLDGVSAYSSRAETPFTPEQYEAYRKVRQSMGVPVSNKYLQPKALGPGKRRVFAMPGRRKAE